MQIHPSDNVEIRENGQKYALCDIAENENVIKYGFAIGHATKDIKKGDMVSPVNLKSNLEGVGKWTYTPCKTVTPYTKNGSFYAYVRKNGDVGIRNELWIVPTVGCINSVAKKIADTYGGKALTHPYGCSQLGGDLEITQKILCGLIKHPNAGGVLVLGLGCENNGITLMKKALGDYDTERVRFLNIQDCEDEFCKAEKIIGRLRQVMDNDKRETVPLSKLKIAVKCGGSDGYSGITANPLVGRTMEKFAEYGAKVLMTEIPEVFGAEQLLLSQCKNEAVFEKAVGMIQRFRQYFISHGEGIAENPSPGNIVGGISTLEEKSLGCVQKSGKVTLCDTVDYGESAGDESGLYLVNGPGNDMVAVTNLTAAGAHFILFTTGRGTPLSAVIPTLKISTNTAIAEKKPHWIDFDAGVLMENTDSDILTDKLMNLCTDTANGKLTKSEQKGYYDIAIFKNGVTL